jgi:hypothetical protein
MPFNFEENRFTGELMLLDQLNRQFGLEAIIGHHEASGGTQSTREMILSECLRITPMLSPRLCGLLKEVQSELGFHQPLELFVQANPTINAFVLHSIHEEQPHMMILTSQLVERMSDDELRFVMGHEIGHVAYQHYRISLLDAALGADEKGQSKMPPLLRLRLGSWFRLAELSADRVGFVAAKQRLGPTVSCFFKLTSGLGPEHLSFDISAFLDQLDEIKKLTRREILAWFSHPATPIRVKALQMFRDSGALKMTTDERTALDVGVASVAQLMDYEVTEDLDVNARNFLLAGGLLAALSKGSEITPDQWLLLVDFMIPFTQDPEAVLKQIQTAEEAERLIEESSAWLRANAGEERFLLFRQIAGVVSIDGALTPSEEECMALLAEKLAIPPKAASKMLFEVLATFLQAQREETSSMPRFALRGETGNEAPVLKSSLCAPPSGLAKSWPGLF